MRFVLVAGLLSLAIAAPALAQLPTLQRSGQSIGFSYYTPTQAARDIDASSVDFSSGWRIWSAFELQRRISIFHGQGTRTDAPYGVDPDSTATGFALGGAARFYPLDLLGHSRVRPFIEGSAQFLFTPGTRDGFPSGGSGVNGFLRAGAGALVQLRPRLALEVSYQWYSHVSDGTSLSEQNPMWNGRGGTVALRRTF